MCEKLVYKINVCLVGLITPIICFSQIKGDYDWQLGFASNPHENPYALSIEVQFGANQLKIDTFYRETSMGYFNSSISNDDGKLLLYSNGCQISDGKHQFIAGTNSLTPGSVDTEWCIQEKVGYPVNLGGLFLPFFKDSVIILLHQRLIIEGPPLGIHVDALFYTSLGKNDSSYTLTEKSILLIDGYLTDGNVSAIKGFGPDTWWVIQGERESNSYYTLRFDSAQLDTIFKQSIGEVTYRGAAAGQSAFSPDGSMYARFNPFDDLFLFDFNRGNGRLSNYRKLHVADSGIIGGIAFSPNNRFLYACGQYEMYQFDLWEEDIQASKILIGHYDGYVDPFPTTFYHMLPGPDCRIYIGSPNGVKTMHVINKPDLKNLDCGFEQHGFHFPVSNSITIPNFPNYRLDLAPPCDPNIVSGLWEYKVDFAPVSIYPNPTSGDLTIVLGEVWENQDQIQIRVVDQLGRVRINKEISTHTATLNFDFYNLPSGLYILSIQSAEQWFTGKITKL